MKAIFLDRDGTVIAGVPHVDRVDSVTKIHLLPETIDGLKVLAGLDYQVFFVTNQAGIAEGLITMADFDAINAEVLRIIESSQITITETYVCPHGEHAKCECRKPKPKMLNDAAKKYGLDLENSWMIGDRETDVLTGINAGTKTILVQTGATNDSQNADFVAKDLFEAANIIAKESK